MPAPGSGTTLLEPDCRPVYPQSPSESVTVESGVHEEREDEPGAHEAHGVGHPTLDGRARRADIRPVGSRWRGSMSKVGQAAIAIVVAAAVLWLAAWLDGTVMRDIQHQEDAAFERMNKLIAASVPEYQLPPVNR